MTRRTACSETQLHRCKAATNRRHCVLGKQDKRWGSAQKQGWACGMHMNAMLLHYAAITFAMKAR